MRHKKKLIQDRGHAVQGAQKALKVQLCHKRVKPVGKNQQINLQPDQEKRQKGRAPRKSSQPAKARKGLTVDESHPKQLLPLISSSPLE